MRDLKFILPAILFLQFGDSAWGYEPSTHEEMSRFAFDASSVKVDADVLKKLGLKPWAQEQQFPNSQNTDLTIIGLAQFGSSFEDDGKRPLNHFYDPANNHRGLTVGVEIGHSSPDWALEDNGDVTNRFLAGEQRYSFKHAREYFYKALTSPARPPELGETTRYKQFGLMFQSLGQIIHHLQDMSQPQHVRNDDHCDGDEDRVRCYGTHNPSWYEKFTNEIRGGLPYGGYPPVVLPTARSYWHTTDNKGIADYTNRGFVSQGTNFRAPGTQSPFSHPDYDFPQFEPEPETKVDIKTLMDTSLNGYLTFYSLHVQDNYLGVAELNGLATTLSVFDKYLKKYDTAYGFGLFTLNEFNFQSGYPLLIPKAVGYSAGLINYFFRGKMEISLPGELVYGIVDNSTLSAPNQGFERIRLKLKNTTPPIAVVPFSGTYEQDMLDGNLVAVVKYRHNPCFTLDYKGEVKFEVGDKIGDLRGKPLEQIVTWTGCNQKQVYVDTKTDISVSQPIPITVDKVVPRGEALPYTFDFSVSPIPIDAVDVYLQVVYRGKMGPIGDMAHQEDDAVVVATKRISAPTPIVWTNTTDYVLHTDYRPDPNAPPEMAYHTLAEAIVGPLPEGYEAGTVSVKVKTNFDPLKPEEAIELVKASDLPVGSFFRVSVLTDPDSLNVSLFVDETVGVVGLPVATKLKAGDYTGYDPEKNKIIVRPMIKARGVYAHPTRAPNDPDVTVYDSLCRYARQYSLTSSGRNIDEDLAYFNSPEAVKQRSDSCRLNVSDLNTEPQPVEVMTFN